VSCQDLDSESVIFIWLYSKQERLMWGAACTLSYETICDILNYCLIFGTNIRILLYSSRLTCCKIFSIERTTGGIAEDGPVG
jgi:hypothetical protein